MMLLVALAACAAPEPTQEPAPTTAPTLSLDSLNLPLPGGVVDAPALEGSVTTSTGLQYLELVAGDGVQPAPGDLVYMHFIGSLPDGTVFANTSEGGEPVMAIFGRDQLLPGWEEGLAFMSTGSVAQMVLPPELAFGSEGYGLIPPDTPVILEITIISVEKPPQVSQVDEADLDTTENGVKFYDLVEGTGAEAARAAVYPGHQGHRRARPRHLT